MEERGERLGTRLGCMYQIFYSNHNINAHAHIKSFVLFKLKTGLANLNIKKFNLSGLTQYEIMDFLIRNTASGSISMCFICCYSNIVSITDLSTFHDYRMCSVFYRW